MSTPQHHWLPSVTLLTRQTFASEHMTELESDIRDRAEYMFIEWRQIFRRKFQHPSKEIIFNYGEPDRSLKSCFLSLHRAVFKSELVRKIHLIQFSCLAECPETMSVTEMPDLTENVKASSRRREKTGRRASRSVCRSHRRKIVSRQPPSARH
jgi:hypothetical protein